MKKTLALILTLVMALSLVTVSYAADLESNLVAHWTFDKIVDTDGVLTVEDVTGNGNTLTIQDTNYKTVTGFTGRAIDFLTDDNYDVANSKSKVDGGVYAGAKHMTMLPSVLAPQLTGKAGITVSFWIKRELVGSSVGNAVFCLSPNGAALKLSTQRYGFVTETRARSTNVPETISVGRFYPLGEATDFYPQIVSNATAATTASDKRHEWVHVTAVNDYTNKEVRVYLDGELVPGGSVTMNWSESVSNFIGEDSKGYIGVGASHSILDDVKIYDKALTQDEVKESIPAVLEYKFEEMMEGSTANATARAASITLPDTAEVVSGAIGNTINMSGKGTLPLQTYYKSLLKSKVISFSTWVKSIDGVLTTNKSGQAVVQEGRGGFNIAVLNNGHVRVGGRSQNGDGYATSQSTKTVFKAGDTNWHHIAGTINYTDDTVILYVDGKHMNTVDYTDNTAATWFQSAFYTFSGHNETQVDYFDLKNDANLLIDETKIYRRGLTANEIAEEYKKVYKDFATVEFTSTSDSVTASCDIFNSLGADLEADKAIIFLGMYDIDSNRLVKVSAKKLPAVASLAELKDQTVTISDIEEPEIYTYRLFIWDGTSLVPYHTENYIIQ